MPQIVVGALLALALVGGGLWAVLRGDSTEVQPPIVGGTTPDPGTPQPVTPKEPPVDVNPPEPPVAVKPPPDGTSSKKPDEQAPKPAVNAPKGPGKLHLILKGWADVYVDGKPFGRVPPKNKLELEPGQYRVELKNPAVKTYVANITIKPGETTQLSVKFEPKASSPTEAQ
jgi:hypothetical protein